MDIHQFEFHHKNSRIKILVDKEPLIDEIKKEIIFQYGAVEDYIKQNPEFLSSTKPINVRKDSQKIIKNMAEGGKIADVGPMAAVAGTIAELGCRKVANKTGIVIVDNGGDIYLSSNKPVIIGVFAGYNKIADKFAFRIKQGKLAICSSSSKLGHSLSFGNCDLVTVFSRKSYVADAVATAVCNRIKKESDIDEALNWGVELKGVDGILAVKGNKIGMVGNLPEIIRNKDELLKDKITRYDIWVNI